MYQEDYILRHIRLFVRMIARVLGLLKEGDPDFALEVIETGFRDYLGLSLDDFLAYPQERLLDFLTFGELGRLGVNKVGFAANLMLQAGTAFRLKQQFDKSQACFEKGLGLILELDLSEQGQYELPDFIPGVSSFTQVSNLAAFSNDVLGALAFSMEKAGDFQQAERVVQAMLQKDPGDPDMKAFARSFYEYLLEESDEALQKGGVERAGLERALQKV